MGHTKPTCILISNSNHGKYWELNPLKPQSVSFLWVDFGTKLIMMLKYQLEIQFPFLLKAPYMLIGIIIACRGASMPHLLLCISKHGKAVNISSNYTIM